MNHTPLTQEDIYSIEVGDELLVVESERFQRVLPERTIVTVDRVFHDMIQVVCADDHLRKYLPCRFARHRRGWMEAWLR